jgi:hypothetical protein
LQNSRPSSLLFQLLNLFVVIASQTVTFAIGSDYMVFMKRVLRRLIKMLTMDEPLYVERFAPRSTPSFDMFKA